MIERADRDGVAVVRLAHPPVNALDLELVTAIADVFEELDAGGPPAVVLTGSGRSFSAGVDLWRVVAGGPDYVREYLPQLCRAFEAIFNVGKPVVAAVNGHAIAGGCILTCACDRRLMVDGPGRIGVPELQVGVPFPTSALEVLEFAVGPRQARETLLSGLRCTPAQALARGLVDRLTRADELVDLAVATARELVAAVPADTFRLTKKQLRQSTTERIAARRPVLDPQVTQVWCARATDGWIRDYMAELKKA